MYRSTCETGPHKVHLEGELHKVHLEGELYCGSEEEGDSSKENSVLDENHTSSPLPTASKLPGGGGGGSPPGSAGRSPWGYTLTPKSGAGGQRLMSGMSLDLTNNSNMSISPSKQNVPWNDLSFAAEVLSPGFTGRVVRAAHVTSPRIVREGRRQYPTAQERYVRAGVMPNVRLGGRTKAVLTPKRTPTSPLIPLSRSPSAFSSSLSSDFLSSATPRMPDIRSVASVLEPVSTSSECVRDPTSVQAVVAALQQAQAGKGVKRGSCYMEAEDLSKRQRCSTPGTSSSSAGTIAMPVNYSRDYMEDNQNVAGNSHASVGNGGEKRALDLSPSQGNSQQISPENKRRCVLDPMHASLSSSRFLDFSRLQGSGRDTPYSMYESRHDTDSESNRSVDSGQSKASEQSLHQQTSEATGGDSCVISPGPSERDLSDRSGSHTPQSTRGESWNSVAGGNGGTANTSRTSTPRNPTPPHHNHVITLEAYKAEKTKSQQRLKKMLGMLFHVNENEETASSKSGSSTPVTSVTIAKPASEPATSAPSTLVSILEDKGSSKTSLESSSSSSSNATVTAAEASKSEVTTTFTFSLKPASNAEKPSGDSEAKAKESSPTPTVESSDVSVEAVIKLPSAKASEGKQPSGDDSSTVAPPAELTVTTTEVVKKPSSLVDFLKTTAPPKTSSGVSDTVAANPLLQSQLSMPSPISVTLPTPISETNPLFNIPSQSSSTTTPSIEGFASTKAPDTSSGPASAGFTFSTSSNTKAPSLFSFGMSSSGASQPDTTASTVLETKPSTSPFVFGSGNAEKLPASTSVTPATSTSVKTSGGMSAAFTFGSTPVTSNEQSNPPPYPSTAAPTTPSFNMPSATTSSQSGIFAFGSVKTTASAPESSTPSISTVGNPSQNTTTPSMMFTFGASAQGPAKTSSSVVTTQQSTGLQALPFKDTALAMPSATSGFSFGASSAGTSASTGAMPQNVVSPSSGASTQQPSTFTFGQPMTSQVASSTTTSSGFNFSSTSQTTGAPSAPSVFQFGTTTTSSQDIKAPSNQLFPPAIGSTQPSATSSSSPFTFGSAATATSAPSPFSFGAPKTENSAPPAFGGATDPSTKPATQSSGFTFSSTPAATTNAFSSAAPSTTTNAFSSTTNTSTSSAGFNFGAATASSGFSFGGSNKPPATTTAPTVSPFSFGGATANKTSFGAPTTTTVSPFSFGSNAAPTPSFGSNPSQGFGAPTTGASTFGTATASFGSSTSSGAMPFGANNAFGASSATPSFGSSFGTGGNNAQAGTATSPFGGQTGSLTFGTSSSTPAFGGSGTTSGTPAFGGSGTTNGTPAFGGSGTTSGTPTFGGSGTTSGTPAFGGSGTTSGTPAFGGSGTTSVTPAFGGSGTTSGTPAFGGSGTTSSTPAFGGSGTASSTPAFGGSGTTTITPTFGASGNAASTTPAFGAPSSTPAAPTFGAPANGAPTFGGSSTTPAGSAFGGTPAPSFAPSFGSASTSTGTNSVSSPFQFGQGQANPPPTFGMGGGSPTGSGVFQFGTANAPSPFNAGNPNAGSRRPRNRASRRHR
ncbi:uncharacterized protein [Palaemon carinicauda]|uniref:uncharacterized protein isoform X2 n=1 Tax=Palaemon carinicauda TaxID=392227 RepID=UPI0035B5AD9D